MGTLDSGLTSALFSRVQSRVLGILFASPERKFQLNEIIEQAKSGRGAVQRELAKLTRTGLVTTTFERHRRTYQANERSPIFFELHNIVVKTVGLVDPIRRALNPYQAKITVAFVYGSIAKAQDKANSDIDLVIIGNGLSYDETYLSLEPVEQILRRPINPNLMSEDEWIRKRSSKNPFVTNILKQPKLFVVGENDDLNRIGQHGKDRSSQT